MSEDRTGQWRWQRIAAIGVLLPLLAAALLIWSASGRQAKLDQVPVAIVNNVQIISDPQPMAAGRSLTAALTHPDAGTTNLDWVLTDSKDATAGLHNGAYYAVLTIPTDFSSSILSSGTDQPQQGKLTLVSNAAASTTVPYISQQIAAAAAASLGQQVTQGRANRAANTGYVNYINLNAFVLPPIKDGAGNVLRGGNEAWRLRAHTGASLRLAVQSGTGEGIWRKG